MNESTYHQNNHLVVPVQLELSASQLDGVPKTLEQSCLFAGARLLQAAGVLLGLPQDVIAQSMVIFSRFWMGAEGGSLKDHGVRDIAGACLSIVTKLSAYTQSPRRILLTLAHVSSKTFGSRSALNGNHNENALENVVDSTQSASRAFMHRQEVIVLRTIGFVVHVALPHGLSINYLQALDAFDLPNGQQLAQRVIAHLNDALLSPQTLYLTHQPSALATAAVYLAAREVLVKLPENEWWEVFDVDREELGFLVVAMQSLEGWLQNEQSACTDKAIPLDIEGVVAWCERRPATPTP